MRPYEHLLTPQQRERADRLLGLVKYSPEWWAVIEDLSGRERSTTRHNARKLSREDAETAAMLLDTATLAEVAAAAGVNVKTLRAALARWGLQSTNRLKADDTTGAGPG